MPDRRLKVLDKVDHLIEEASHLLTELLAEVHETSKRIQEEVTCDHKPGEAKVPEGDKLDQVVSNVEDIITKGQG